MIDFEILNTKLEDLQNQDAKERLEGKSTKYRIRIIPRDTAEFLAVFARTSQAKLIVEIGGSVGYSTIWLGLATKSIGGRVMSFDTDTERTKIAEDNISLVGLSDTVTVINGNILENQDLLPEEIDLVFLDAEKDDYVAHFNQLFSKIKPGGVIIADNVISHFDDLKGYVNLVRTHDECSSVLLSGVGKGLEITYKHINGEKDIIPWQQLIR